MEELKEQQQSASSEVENVSETVDPLETLNTLKQNSVSKEEYNKVLAERNRYFNACANGIRVETKPEKPKVDIDALRKDLYGGKDHTNLDYIEKTLQLREALMERGEPDPFIPYGHKYSPTDEDIATAKKLADGLQYCVDRAEGDSEVFTNELQRITVDVAPMVNKRKY